MCGMIDKMIEAIKAMDDDEWIPALVESGHYRKATTLIAIRCSHAVSDDDVAELHKQMANVREGL